MESPLAGRAGSVRPLGVNVAQLSSAAKPFFVADPAAVRPDVAEDAGRGLELAHQAPGGGPVVIGEAVDVAFFAGAAVVAVAAVGAVEPDLEEGSVTGEQLAELAVVDRQVGRRAVGRAVAVPGRAVEPEAETVLLGGVGILAHEIAFAAAPGRPRDIVFGGPGGPEAETVVMFGHQDDAVHAAALERRHDLSGVESGRIEKRGLFAAVAPLAVGVGVQAVVDQRENLRLVPAQLALGRHGAVGRGGVGLRTGGSTETGTKQREREQSAFHIRFSSAC